MRAILIAAVTTLLTATPALAKVACEASVTIQSTNKGEEETEILVLATMPSTERPNTIISERTRGMELAIAFDTAETAAVDVSNYSFMDPENNLVVIESNTPLIIAADGSVLVSHLMKIAGARGLIDATFTMLCKR